MNIVTDFSAMRNSNEGAFQNCFNYFNQLLHLNLISLPKKCKKLLQNYVSVSTSHNSCLPANQPFELRAECKSRLMRNKDGMESKMIELFKIIVYN